jgi:hypothetical protein
MSHDNTVSRTLHDLGLAAWFGGSLIDAVSPDDSAGSAREVIGLAAMGAYGAGSLGLTLGNRGRLGAQRGVASLAAAKTAVSVAAMGAMVYAAYLRRQAAQARSAVAPADAASEAIGTSAVGNGGGAPSGASGGPLAMVRAAMPALTGALIVMNARMGEQQRPLAVARGVAGRVAQALPERERLTDALPDRVVDALPDRVSDVGDRIADLLPDALSDLIPERVAARL